MSVFDWRSVEGLSRYRSEHWGTPNTWTFKGICSMPNCENAAEFETESRVYCEDCAEQNFSEN